jgi:lysozyme family protein
MAAGCFEKCHAVTAVWEGGWSNHPADPGGATMYGITLAKFREHYPKATAAQLKIISRQTALAIYKSDYWAPVNGETLAPGVDLAVYDAAVNSGVGRAKKWLLASVGGADTETVKRICAKRLGFVQALKTWKTFGKGWARRIADIEAKGVAWAMAAAATPGVVKARLDREAEAAKSKAAAQTKTAGGAAVGGGAVTQAPVEQLNSTAGIVLLVVIAGAIVGLLIWRAHVNKQRAAAYAAESGAV